MLISDYVLDKLHRAERLHIKNHARDYKEYVHLIKAQIMVKCYILMSAGS